MKYLLTEANIQALEELYEIAKENLGDIYIERAQPAVRKVIDQASDKADEYFIELTVDEQDVLIELIEKAKQSVRNLDADLAIEFNRLMSALKNPAKNSG